MKKIILKSICILLAVLMLTTQSLSAYGRTIRLTAPAIDESIFVLDENLLNSALSELNELESYLETNEKTTYTDLISANEIPTINLDNLAMPMGMGNQEETGAPLGIPSYLWGCFLGGIGIIMVYLLTDENADEAKKALWGCITTVSCAALIYIGIIVLAVSEGATYTY